MKWTLSISKRNGEDPDLSVGSPKKKKSRRICHVNYKIVLERRSLLINNKIKLLNNIIIK